MFHRWAYVTFNIYIFLSFSTFIVFLRSIQWRRKWVSNSMDHFSHSTTFEDTSGAIIKHILTIAVYISIVHRNKVVRTPHVHARLSQVRVVNAPDPPFPGDGAALTPAGFRRRARENMADLAGTRRLFAQNTAITGLFVQRWMLMRA